MLAPNKNFLNESYDVSTYKARIPFSETKRESRKENIKRLFGRRDRCGNISWGFRTYGCLVREKRGENRMVETF